MFQLENKISLSELTSWYFKTPEYLNLDGESLKFQTNRRVDPELLVRTFFLSEMTSSYFITSEYAILLSMAQVGIFGKIDPWTPIFLQSQFFIVKINFVELE